MDNIFTFIWRGILDNLCVCACIVFVIIHIVPKADALLRFYVFALVGARFRWWLSKDLSAEAVITVATYTLTCLNAHAHHTPAQGNPKTATYPRNKYLPEHEEKFIIFAIWDNLFYRHFKLASPRSTSQPFVSIHVCVLQIVPYHWCALIFRMATYSWAIAVSKWLNCLQCDTCELCAYACVCALLC